MAEENLTVRLWFRVTPETAAKLDAFVKTVPGDKSDVCRVALEKYLDTQIALRRITEEAYGITNPHN